MRYPEFRRIIALRRDTIVHRMLTRREVVPGGMLGPGDAVRESGLTPGEFIAAVRAGRITPIEVAPGVRAFRVDDVKRLTPPLSRSSR